MDKTPEVPDALHRVKRGRPVKTVEPVEQAPNQLLALRIWDGQSPDLAVNERCSRIAAGLKAQGLNLDNVELPHPDAGRYLGNI